MLISTDRIEKEMGKPKGILQLGAYDGEEKSVWDSWGVSNVMYVEPNPDLFKKLVEKVGKDYAYSFAFCDKDHLQLLFHRTYSKDRTNLGVSSLFQPKSILENSHLEWVDTIFVETISLDTFLIGRSDIDFLVMDAEGAELSILYGGQEVLPQFKGILTEFTLKSRFDGDCLLPQLDTFLKHYNFERVITEFATEERVWGDCLYIRRDKQ